MRHERRQKEGNLALVKAAAKRMDAVDRLGRWQWTAIGWSACDGSVLRDGIDDQGAKRKEVAGHVWAAAGWLSFLFPPPSSSILPPPSVVIFSFQPSTPDTKQRLVLFVCCTTPIWLSTALCRSSAFDFCSASSPGPHCAAIPTRSRLFEGADSLFPRATSSLSPPPSFAHRKPSDTATQSDSPYSSTAKHYRRRRFSAVDRLRSSSGGCARERHC